MTKPQSFECPHCGALVKIVFEPDWLDELEDESTDYDPPEPRYCCVCGKHEDDEVEDSEE